MNKNFRTLKCIWKMTRWASTRPRSTTRVIMITPQNFRLKRQLRSAKSARSRPSPSKRPKGPLPRTRPQVMTVALLKQAPSLNQSQCPRQPVSSQRRNGKAFRYSQNSPICCRNARLSSTCASGRVSSSLWTTPANRLSAESSASTSVRKNLWAPSVY